MRSGLRLRAPAVDVDLILAVGRTGRVMERECRLGEHILIFEKRERARTAGQGAAHQALLLGLGER